MIRTITHEYFLSNFPFCEVFNQWESYFRFYMKDKVRRSLDWEGSDPNIRGYNSNEEFMERFCYHPTVSVPYRDFGFYYRELTVFSIFFLPQVIVELGTYLGSGTFILSALNPDAKVYTVDNKDQFILEGRTFNVGEIASINEIPYTLIKGNSWETKIFETFDMCLIDADHSRESVWKDSLWAWENKSGDNYIIMWHDYNFEDSDCAGLIRAVNDFTDLLGIDGYKLEDSTLAWLYKI